MPRSARCAACSARSSGSTASLSPSDLTLGDLLADLLDETAGVEVLADREYARDGVAFAARTDEDVIELRLGRDIAAAARRTPGTSPSPRGPDWVRFVPQDWDRFAVDRLQAWFRLAWRAATRRSPPSA